MKLIITEAHAEFLIKEGDGKLVNAIGNKLSKAGQRITNKAIEKGGDILPTVVNKAAEYKMAQDPPIELSPEIAARFDNIDIEKTAPNLSKFLSSLKVPTAATGSADIFKSNPNIPEGNELMHPLGRKAKIHSAFGKRNVTSEPKASKFHMGLDLEAGSGSPVYAPSDGVVVRAEDTTPNGCGGHVRIKHSKNFETKYCHLKNWKVKRGDKVKKGDIIGYSGGGKNDPYRGVSTGPHLHYSTVVNGKEIDPLTVQPNLV